MPRVAPAAVTELAELEAVGVVPPVLDRRVVAFLAVGTLQSDDRRPALRRSHVICLDTKNKPSGARSSPIVPEARRRRPRNGWYHCPPRAQVAQRQSNALVRRRPWVQFPPWAPCF